MAEAFKLEALLKPLKKRMTAPLKRHNAARGIARSEAMKSGHRRVVAFLSMMLAVGAAESVVGQTYTNPYGTFAVLEGPYSYAGSSKIFEIYPGPYACWAIDPSELEAINIQHGWAGHNTTPPGTINFGSGSPNKYCAWPNGMFKPSDTNSVYAVYGATQSTPGTSCHVLNDAQVADHGGWNLVWRPNYPTAAMHFKQTSHYIGNCPY